MTSHKTSKILAFALGALALAGAAAIAHHVSTPLSSVLGQDVLSEVVLHLRGTNVGIPPYAVSDDEFGHDAVVAIQAGDQFSVESSSGAIEVVSFRASDFADTQAPTLDEAIAAINSQLTIGIAYFDNAHLVVRGNTAGVSSKLQFKNVRGTPLTTLHIAESHDFVGADTVGLTLSIPAEQDPSPNAYANLPYAVLVSTHEGATDLGNGVTLPLLTDGTTRQFLQAARTGLLPSFLGTLDSNEDGSAILPIATMQQILSPIPSAVYLAFVVYTADGKTPIYASNRFTLKIVQ